VNSNFSTTPLAPKKIIIAGDVVIDFMSVSLPTASPIRGQDWQKYHNTKLVHRCGGALLVADLLSSNLGSNDKNKFVFSYEHEQEKGTERWIVQGIQPEKLVHSFSAIKQFSSIFSDDKNKVFRVSAFAGFGGPGPAIVFPHQFAADLVILSETESEFRNSQALWPRAIDKKKSPLVILKSGANLKQSKLLNFLLKNHNNRLLVIANASDLRSSGALISHGVSWERTAIEFSSEMTRNPILGPLKRCKNLLVRFGLEGVIHYKGQTNKASIIYDPNRGEGDYSQQFSGHMSGFGSAFCASLAIDFYNERSTKIDLTKLGPYIRNALVATRRLLKFGLGQDSSELRIQHEEVFSRSSAARQFVASNVPTRAERLKNASETWSFIKNIDRPQLYALAKDIVLRGRMAPNPSGIPLARFGALETIDRSEIESYRTIRNLMREFLLGASPARPLSIAVFGQPGSGKSFGITEIAHDLGSKKIGNIGKRFTFNVAQFASERDLTAAFHIARDEVLKGEVPILFFDEFDARFNDKPLYWLQYFLAPMQDGVFKDDKAVHSVGKAIFVFAGGIYHSFEKFAKAGLKTDGKKAKLPDFKSRLRGYVDILSPNPSKNSRDNSFLIRRAVILRSLLRRKCPHLINAINGVANIDDGVLDAFLQVPQYKHDVRSIEALLDMSMLAGRTGFGSSALPTDDQMEMHVDSTKFLKLVSGESEKRGARKKLRKRTTRKKRTGRATGRS
jgi:hypothetical protein